MSRIDAVSYDQAPEASQGALDKIKASYGGVANIFSVFANSPVALNGYLALNQSLAEGLLDESLREQIALTVASVNQCDYCASAHSVLGRMAGLDDNAVNLAMSAKADDGKTEAVLQFAKSIAENRGQVSDAEIGTLKELGFCNGFIVEVIANVALNVLTNYVNNAAQTEVDFPFVSAKVA